MGITDFSRSLLLDIISKHRPQSVIELGSQQLYFNGPNYGKYADLFYRDGYGMDYHCIDLNGENGAYRFDLSKRIGNLGEASFDPEQFDLVTDFGTSEHVQGFYRCWLTKWGLCKKGGAIVSENPKTGNWPGHGFNYVTKEFYVELSKALGMPQPSTDCGEDPEDRIIVGEHPAMGNTTDGWNVWCIMVKNREEFITEEEFNKLPWHKQ